MATSNSRPATLQQIAADLGLHVSTVSRILNASPADGARAASAKTVERVRAYAKEIDYRPNPLGTGLRTKRTHQVAALVPRLSDLVLSTIFEGIDEAASEVGLSAFVTNTFDDPQVQKQKVELALSRRVDGIILGDSRLDGVLADELRRRKVPYVLVNRRAPGHVSVVCDDYLGGRLAAEHLYGRGHRAVGIVAAQPYASTGVDRCRGFVDFFAEHECPIPDDLVAHCGFDAESGAEAADRLLRHHRELTALFAVNDFSAIGAMSAGRRHGRNIGADLAVVGFNDIAIARQLAVPLSSVHSDMHGMGREAVATLVRIIAGEEPPSRAMPPELVVRDSSDFDVNQPSASTEQ
ncbi:LacI family transcriptional regulator [Nocardia neocaledoniensis NBRC 108232]|uniref:LacI family transcriptional regulator n=1 Tax=Nocardia neocaledoniensis TaxID=236511 RepID=A0A317NHE5_9NOCA|nr:LacI family DNA-binding transcriptional regulator [Nocardia neocaledoniensis]PWV74500.1 LacI family transcriptional regulator [Nocardia neocaledoniensis]GEM28997.1 LacI family transcriptional regulator [Nocardia neocaledoniensis NBRC 108232]